MSIPKNTCVIAAVHVDDCVKGDSITVELQLPAGDGLPFRSVSLLPDEARALAAALVRAAARVESFRGEE